MFKNKEKVNSQSFRENHDSFLDDEIVSPTKEGNIVDSSKNHSMSNKKFIWVLAIMLVPLISFKCVNSYLKNVESKKAVAQQVLKEQMLSEPHTSMQYYLENGPSELALEGTAKLVGHVMDTGCTTAYDILRAHFDEDSLKCLYSYLNGMSCDYYSTAKVVCLKEEDYMFEYMIRMSKTGDKLKIIVSHDKGKPIAFKLDTFTE